MDGLTPLVSQNFNVLYFQIHSVFCDTAVDCVCYVYGIPTRGKQEVKMYRIKITHLPHRSIMDSSVPKHCSFHLQKIPNLRE